MTKEELLKKAFDSMIDCDEEAALETVDEAIAEGMDLVELLTGGFSAGMTELGEQFNMGEIFLPELIITSEVMKKVAAKIEENMDSSNITNKGTMVIGTVEGDVHDIGKGIVASLVKSNGVNVIDLGRDVPAETFVQAAIDNNADFIGSSALLTTTMGIQKDIEEILEEKGMKDRFKTVIGGAPVTIRWADKIGADKYCEDATATVNFINDFYAD